MTPQKIETTNVQPRRQSEAGDSANVRTFGHLPELSGQALQELFGLLGIEHSDTVGQLAQATHEDLRAAAHRSVCAGARLLLLKERTEHGDFMPELEKLGIERRRAWELMCAATFVGNMPPQDARKLLSIGKSNLLALAQAEPEAVEALLNDDDIDVNELSNRELKRRLKQQEDRANRLDALLEKEQAKTTDLQRTLANRRASQVFPEFLAVARQEAAALNAELAAATDALEQLADEHVFAVADAPSTDPKLANNVELAAGAVLHAVRGELARLHKLADRLSEQFGAALDEPGRFLLTDEEAAQAKADADFIHLRHSGAKAQRHVDRENARPGKRGRKMKAAS